MKKVLLCLVFLMGFMVYASSPVKESVDDPGLSDYELVEYATVLPGVDVIVSVEAKHAQVVHKIELLESENFNSSTVCAAESNPGAYHSGFIRMYNHRENNCVIVKKKTVQTGFRRFYLIE